MARKRTVGINVKFTPSEHDDFMKDCDMFGFKASALMRRRAQDYLKQLKRAHGMR